MPAADANRHHWNLLDAFRRNRDLSNNSFLPTKNTMKLLYNLNEAATKLGISRKTLEREMKARRFPAALKVATNSYVSANDLNHYVAMLERVREETVGVPGWKKALHPDPLPQSAENAPQRGSPSAGWTASPIRNFHKDDPKRLP